jgi:hypothetical protein
MKGMASRVRRQLIAHLEDAYDGDELILKEIWEMCQSDLDWVEAKTAVKEVIDWLKHREFGEAKHDSTTDSVEAVP